MGPLADITWAHRPAAGRVFSGAQKVRLADTHPDGRLRLDAAARYLQDVAGDDVEDADHSGRWWVVRRTTIRVGPAGWPVLYDTLTLDTWCSGIGRAWAERRTEVRTAGGEVAFESVALWIHVNRQGRPARLDDAFTTIYAGAAGDRHITTAVPPPPVIDGPGVAWPLRRIDLDVAGHVNNAAVWAPVVEVAPTRPTAASVVHHGPVNAGDDVVLRSARGEGSVVLTLSVGGEVRVSAVVCS